MTQSEIAIAKIDAYACKNAYELTIEKYPNEDIRRVHDDIRIINSDNAEDVNNYYWRTHHAYVTLVCHGKRIS